MQDLETLRKIEKELLSLQNTVATYEYMFKLDGNYTVGEQKIVNDLNIGLQSVVFFDDRLVNYIEPKLIATLGASLVLISPSLKLDTKSIISLWLNKIGLISYSLYLLSLMGHHFVYYFFH